MRQARSLRGGLAALALSWVGSVGCYHPYYYQPPSPCDPAVIQSGTVTGDAGTVGARSSVNGGSTPRTVVSKPRGMGGSWRQSAPESEAPTTIVEGGLETDTVIK